MPKGKIFQYPEDALKNALKAIRENGVPVAQAARIFNVPRTTLRRKLKDDCNLRKKVGPPCVLGDDIEQKLVEWVLTLGSMGFPISREELIFSVKKLVDESGIKTPFINNIPGKKWCLSFEKRHPEVSRKRAEYINKARASVTEESIRAWFLEVETALGDDLQILNFPKRVWNMDETAIFLSPKGTLLFGEKGKPLYDITSTSEKDNITTLITASAEGEIAPPLSIFKYDRLPKTIVKSAPPDWGIGKSDTGWMKSEQFYEYFANIFYPYLLKQNAEFPIIIFMDGHGSHLSVALSKFCTDKRIILICLPPNTTHILQPLDVSFFAPLKKGWKKVVRSWIFNHAGESIQKKDVPAALNSVLQKQNLKDDIKSGFQTCGLCPFNPDAVNYQKCVRDVKPVTPKVITCKDTEPENCEELHMIERNLDETILNEFKFTYQSKLQWEGKTQYVELYKFWEKIKRKYESEEITREETETGPEYSDSPISVDINENINVKTEEILDCNKLNFDNESDVFQFPFPEYDHFHVDASKNEGAKIHIIENLVIVPPMINAMESNSNVIYPVVTCNSNEEKQTNTKKQEQCHENETIIEETINTEMEVENTVMANKQETSINNNGSENKQFMKVQVLDTEYETQEHIENQVDFDIQEENQKAVKVTKTVTECEETERGREQQQIEKEISPPEHTGENNGKPKDIKDILEQVIIWPETNRGKKRKQKKHERLPSVLTSQQWLEIAEAKEKEKTKKEEAKRIKREKRDIAAKAKELQKETTDAAPKLKELQKGQHVIVCYEKEFYPAKILARKQNMFFCSAMKKSGQYWKWPEKADTLWYSSEDLIQTILEPIPVNSRGMYAVPTLK